MGSVSQSPYEKKNCTKTVLSIFQSPEAYLNPQFWFINFTDWYTKDLRNIFNLAYATLSLLLDGKNYYSSYKMWEGSDIIFLTGWVIFLYTQLENLAQVYRVNYLYIIQHVIYICVWDRGEGDTVTFLADPLRIFRHLHWNTASKFREHNLTHYFPFNLFLEFSLIGI